MTDPKQEKEKCEVKEKSFGMMEVNRKVVKIRKIDPPRLKKMLNGCMDLNKE